MQVSDPAPGQEPTAARPVQQGGGKGENGKGPVPRRRWRRYVAWAAVAVFALLVVGASALYVLYAGVPGQPALDQPVSVLLMGSDQRFGDLGRTDTMMLVTLSPPAQKVTIVSLPRDTRVRLPGYPGWHKINEANGVGGPRFACQVVGDLLGVPVQHYVIIDFQGFEKVIDELGGVTVDVPVAMNYDDNAQDLHIHLQPGRQHLDGRQALGFVRYRADGLGDVSYDPQTGTYDGRIQRQQAFARALANQVLRPQTVAKLPELLRSLQSVARTDIRFSEMVRYAGFIQQLGPGALQTAVVPGSGETLGGVSYWVLDESRLEVLRQQMGQTVRPAVASSERPSQPVPSATFAKPGGPPVTTRLGLLQRAVQSVGQRVLQWKQARLQAEEQGKPLSDVNVEVLNGTGKPGMASKVAGLLRQQGARVAYVGNADAFNYPQTLAVDNGGAAVQARKVAAVIHGRVVSGPRGTLTRAKVTVVVGADFRD